MALRVGPLDSHNKKVTQKKRTKRNQTKGTEVNMKCIEGAIYICLKNEVVPKFPFVHLLFFINKKHHHMSQPLALLKRFF